MIKWAWITPARGLAPRSIILQNGTRVPTAQEKIYPDAKGIEVWASRDGQVVLVPEGMSPPLDKDGGVIMTELLRLIRGDATATVPAVPEPTQVVVTFKPPPPATIVTANGETLVPVSNSAPRVPASVVPDVIAVNARQVAANAAVAPAQPIARVDTAGLAAFQKELMAARVEAKRAAETARAAVDAVNTLAAQVQKALGLIDQLDQVSGDRQDKLEARTVEVAQIVKMLQATVEGVSQRALLRKEPLFGKKKINGITDGEVIDG